MPDPDPDAKPDPIPPDLDADAAAESAVLHSAAGGRLLASVAEVAEPGPGDLMRWRREATADEVAAAVRLVEARRRGLVKFPRADRMWLTRRGLEQATAEAVADHKARRLAATAGAGGHVVDLCSGIGGDSIALARLALRVTGVDLDPAMAARLAWNAAAHDVADRVEPITAGAEGFTIPDSALVHVDPDRRVASSRKSNAVVEYVPGLAALRGWVASTRGGAIKLGPASDFAAHFGGPGFEIEVISLRGECKEATAWFGATRTPGVERRATALPAGATWTDRDGDHPPGAPGPGLAVGPVDRWVFDPDPALGRAGLAAGFARAHGWTRFAAGVDLFTGPEPTATPLAQVFEVVAVLPLDLKALRREVARRELGPLEIKTRGVATPPEALRRQLRPVGPNPATLLLVGGRGEPGRSILARRVEAR